MKVALVDDGYVERLGLGELGPGVCTGKEIVAVFLLTLAYRRATKLLDEGVGLVSGIVVQSTSYNESCAHPRPCARYLDLIGLEVDPGEARSFSMMARLASVLEELGDAFGDDGSDGVYFDELFFGGLGKSIDVGVAFCQQFRGLAADVGDAEGNENSGEGAGAAGVDGGKNVGSALVGHALQG